MIPRIGNRSTPAIVVKSKRQGPRMSSSQKRKPNYGRRFMWFAAVIVLLLGVYCAAWFYVAGKIEVFAAEAIAKLNRDGASAACTNPVARGFPWGIGLNCDSVRFAGAPQRV